MERSIPAFSTATVDFLISNRRSLRSYDVILLATCGGANACTDTNVRWVQAQLAKLRSVFPSNRICAHTSGLADAYWLARETNVDCVNLNFEPGFGTESEPWTTSQATWVDRIAAHREVARSLGKIPVISPSGRGVPWRDGWWNYQAFANSVGSSFPNVVQTQRDAESQAEDGTYRFNLAVALLAAQAPGFCPQITVNPNEVNGINSAEQAMQLIRQAEAYTGKRLPCLSIWSNASVAGEFAELLAATADR